MWKILVVLLLTAFAIFVARLADDAPMSGARQGVVTGPTPVLMYAGIRG
ncbi:MAG: hypothetical protein ACR2J1_06205 [Methyloceanibacter sp.]